MDKVTILMARVRRTVAYSYRMIAFATEPTNRINQYDGLYGSKPKARPKIDLVNAHLQFLSAKRNQRQIEGKYDAAQDSDEFKNYWAATDAFDADSANSLAVRQKLVRRSRYEIANNGYADGIAQTYATDMIGKGPQLRMQTGSEGFNRLVETAWYLWTKEIHFRRKLWCMCHAKHSDGEGFGVLRRNRGLRHPVKLDLVLHETEQCQTPYLPYNQEGYIDGIEFDRFGNPTFYDFLRVHPGSTNYTNHYFEPEKVPARFVLHWFKLRRPGQHRGVPESASTLNLGASARRFREAVVAAAENIADHTLLIKTTLDANDIDAVEPMSTLEVQKRMMTALPAGYDAFQPKAEQPTSTYVDFSKSMISEQARPRSMPLNKAACDSSTYNYASGRLDHQTYYAELDVDREDCNDLVLDPCFDVWFDLAIQTYGWLGGDPEAIGPAARFHVWDWPKHQVADIKAEAAANDTRLKNGTASLVGSFTEDGRDYEDELEKTASANGVTVDQQRQINMLLNLPQHVIPVVSQILGLQSEPPAPSAQEPEPANG